MNIVIYARYSSDRQTEQSIEGQLKVCHAYAESNGHTVIYEYIDRAMTGKTDSRPQFQKMIRDSKKKQFQGVLVYQLDRFARNRLDSAVYKNTLALNGVKILSARENITDDASGVLMEGLLESMAEYYSVELSQKVKRGMNINAEKCLSNGGTIPFGYKSVDKHLVIDEETAPFVKAIFEMYANGSRASEIAQYLNDRNIRTASGALFNKNSLHTILQNKKYIGIYRYGDVEVPGGIPRIVSDELFQKVAQVLVRNKKNAGHNKAKTEYLLTTKLFCGHCNAPMVGVSARSKTERIYYYYSCNGARAKTCHKKNVSKELVEEIVVRKCRELLTDDNIRRISANIAAIARKEQNSSELRRLNRCLKENRTAIDNLMKALESGQNIDLISDRITQKRKEREELEKCIATEKLRRSVLTETDISFFLTNLKNGDSLRVGSGDELQRRRTLINIFVNEIYLFDDKLTIFFHASEYPVTVDATLLEEVAASLKGKKDLDTNQCGSPNFAAKTLILAAFLLVFATFSM